VETGDFDEFVNRVSGDRGAVLLVGPAAVRAKAIAALRAAVTGGIEVVDDLLAIDVTVQESLLEKWQLGNRRPKIIAGVDDRVAVDRAVMDGSLMAQVHQMFAAPYVIDLRRVPP
jgi:hypothetical protein